jgi:YidC/Oxa1 family membrane protein insertase
LFTPPATDENSRMQLQMMKYMTVFMGFLFFKVPAGLCIYFIASSLWGIAERLLVPKPKVNLKTAEPAPSDRVRKTAPAWTGSNGGSEKRPARKRHKRP